MGYNGIRTIIKPRRFSSFRKFFEEKKKGGLLRARGEREREVSGLIGLFAKSTRANTRRREREGNKPAERSVLILARKLRKTKEACRNSAPLDKSADRSSKRKRPVSTSKNLAITQQRLRQPSLQPTHRSARASPSYPPSRSVGGGAGSAWFPCGKPRKERRRRRRPTRRFCAGFSGSRRWRKWRARPRRERGPFVEMPSVPLFAEPGEALSNIGSSRPVSTPSPRVRVVYLRGKVARALPRGRLPFT